MIMYQSMNTSRRKVKFLGIDCYKEYKKDTLLELTEDEFFGIGQDIQSLMVNNKTLAMEIQR